METSYTKLDDISEQMYSQLMKQVQSSPWRQSYHIQPGTGLLNDPNGLAWYNGFYHLFYQWFPLGPVHGIKYWYHLRSKDLFHWEDLGVALAPDRDFDSHGVYSGSSIEKDGLLYLFYTGNQRDEDWVRHSSQCLATMDKDGKITKAAAPLIPEPPQGITEHFRDPKVWKGKNGYFMIAGAQKCSQLGTALLYQSSDLMQWDYRGELAVPWKTKAFMWECPDYFELGDNGILMLSPQGVETEESGDANIYESGYLIGPPMNEDTLAFDGDRYQRLDYGFDFYAPQTFEDPMGRRILLGWMGLPEIQYPTDRYGWAHCMTIPRELTVKEGRIRQNPVKEIELLRTESICETIVLENNSFKDARFYGRHYELMIQILNQSAGMLEINIRQNKQEQTTIRYSSEDKTVCVDRSISGEVFAEDYGFLRKAKLERGLEEIRIFSDESSLEIFINQGEVCFSLRIFPQETGVETEFIAKEGCVKAAIQKWNLKV